MDIKRKKEEKWVYNSFFIEMRLGDYIGIWFILLKFTFIIIIVSITISRLMMMVSVVMILLMFSRIKLLKNLQPCLFLDIAIMDEL